MQHPFIFIQKKISKVGTDPAICTILTPIG